MKFRSPTEAKEILPADFPVTRISIRVVAGKNNWVALVVIISVRISCIFIKLVPNNNNFREC